VALVAGVGVAYQ